VNQVAEIEHGATQCGSLFSWLAAELVERTSAGGYARIQLGLRDELPSFSAGQFLLLRFKDQTLLPRAFSPVRAEGTHAELLIKEEGLVREQLASCPPGTQIEVRGPYGTPLIEVIERDRTYVLAGGGSGVAPLLCFRAQHPDLVSGTVFGFRPAGVQALFPDDRIVAEERGDPLADSVTLSQRTEADGLIACGPEPMLASLARALPGDPDLYVSLETRLGCGIGACLGCSIETTAGMRRVCVDGPAFRAVELPWLT